MGSLLASFAVRSARSAIVTEILCSVQMPGGQQAVVLFIADGASGQGVMIMGEDTAAAQSCIAKFSTSALSSDTVIDVAPGVDAALVVAIYMASLKLEARLSAQKTGLILGGARDVRF